MKILIYPIMLRSQKNEELFVGEGGAPAGTGEKYFCFDENGKEREQYGKPWAILVSQMDLPFLPDEEFYNT